MRVVLLAFLLAGCASAPVKVDVGPSPAIRAACPPAQRLEDPSFGATTEALTRLGITYRACRAAVGLRDDPAIEKP